MPIDHLLLIGFGGPTKPEEVRPFLERLTLGAKIPPQRLKEVEHHYEQTGGASPYNRLAINLCKRLVERLQADGVDLPVFLGMRNWNPPLTESLAQIKQLGLKRGLAIILAPHRSEASFDRYVKSLEEAKIEADAAAIKYKFLKPWHEHPLFIDAQADRIRPIWQGLQTEDRLSTQILFTAHSIPVEMSDKSSYDEQVRATSAAVSNVLRVTDWDVAYQSRSGAPTQPWLEPDVLSVLGQIKKRGKKLVVAVPVGFLFDHTEVLYDLDIEAKEEAGRQGLGFWRAPTVMDHPKFVEMFSQLVQDEALSKEPAK